MTPAEAPLTPDFIEHAWCPLIEAGYRDDFVELRWRDGFVWRAYSLWLLENAPSIGFDSIVREGTIDPAVLPPPDVIESVAVRDDGALRVVFLGGAACRFHPGWLRYVADGRLTAGDALPPATAWTAAEMTSPPTIDGRAVLERSEVRREWLETLVSLGLCRLTGAGRDPEMLTRLMAELGPIRSSNFGHLFHVRSSQTPDSTANTSLMLGPHTDLPTRETPPGFQFLHCIENSVVGGHSRMTDGMALVRALEIEAPTVFEILTKQSWLFMNRAADAEHRWEGPIVELPGGGRPLTLRAFYPVRSAPRMADEKIPAAYEALRVFSRYARDPRFEITFALRPGDVVCFDNRRVLHGRDAFSEGRRHLIGCYVDHDDVHARLRVLKRSGGV